MILREALNLSKSIANYRMDMYKLTKEKSFSDPDVIKISQQLEFKIQNIKNISKDIRSF
ncbi:aspartyl-phosphate phosphatase Spo0E family protein [Priestia megaterium]|uniref:aspartyl-phosphate phosphatase Spo0E family protein n=1 Tax=Priestia megaterium TaxID=1404 RepID=UPI0021D68F63|nr:aspartyl-phosphate phosphatase Spo0E family protein [Priestia megaterium]MCU7746782.1 aspartyl-phosphate phosphatase Spo0E family protein [Priestia megaterium]